LSDLIQQVNAILNPDGPSAGLEIEATSKNSFDVHLILGIGSVAAGETIRLLTSQPMSAAYGAKTLADMTGSVLDFIKRRKNEPIVAEGRGPDGRTTVQLASGTHLEYQGPILIISEDAGVRRTARDVLRPVGREGVSDFEYSTSAEGRKVLITRDDLPSFEISSQERDISDASESLVLIIIAPSFAPGTKWRVTDGVSPFWTAIEDRVFLASVTRRERGIFAGDSMRCQVQVRQWMDASGILKAERIVTKVLEWIPAPHTLPMFDPDLLDQPEGAETGHLHKK
jgi:hypothetical protein